MPPDDGRLLHRLLPPRPAPEPDEDAPPRPIARGKADLSGDFSVDIRRWLWAAGRYGGFLTPAAGYTILVGGAAYSLIAASVWIGAALPLTGPIGTPAVLLCVAAASSALLFGPLLAGLIDVALRDIRHLPWGPMHFYAGFSRYGDVLLLTLILSLAAAVCFAPFIAASYAVARMSLRPDFLVPALAVCVPLALYVWTRWSFALLLLLDQGMAAPEALAASWRLTRRNVLPLMGYNLLLGLALLAGLATCFGVLLVYPLVVLSHGLAYLQATKQPAGPEGPAQGSLPDGIDRARKRFGGPPDGRITGRPRG